MSTVSINEDYYIGYALDFLVVPSAIPRKGSGWKSCEIFPISSLCTWSSRHIFIRYLTCASFDACACSYKWVNQCGVLGVVSFARVFRLINRLTPELRRRCSLEAKTSTSTRGRSMPRLQTSLFVGYTCVHAHSGSYIRGYLV